MSEIEFAVIGGSGLYQMPELTEVEERVIETPFGSPSDSITVGRLHGRLVAFLPRHGRGHLLNPTEVPYRANIYALKSLGVKYIVSVSACGSLQEECAPSDIVVPDQLFDHTKKRQSSFFEEGLVVHVSVAEPFCPQLSDVLYETSKDVGGTVHKGGTFITIEGPRFSTKGESELYRKWGCRIIGMTTSPEAFLATEAEIAYACMAHVTDYDVWHETEEAVTIEMVIRTVQGNTRLAQKVISKMVADMDQWTGDFPSHHKLADAILTDRSKITDEVKEKFALLAGKYL